MLNLLEHCGLSAFGRCCSPCALVLFLAKPFHSFSVCYRRWNITVLSIPRGSYYSCVLTESSLSLSVIIENITAR